jgi:hypothetical protein
MKNILPLLIILVCFYSCSYNDEIIFSVNAVKSVSSNNEYGYSFQVTKSNFEISEDKENSIVKKLKNSPLINPQGKTYDFIGGVFDGNYKIYSVAEVSNRTNANGINWRVLLVVCNVYNELISLHELAVWNSDTNTICSGEITKELTINKVCGLNNELTSYKISDAQMIKLQ